MFFSASFLVSPSADASLQRGNHSGISSIFAGFKKDLDIYRDISTYQVMKKQIHQSSQCCRAPAGMILWVRGVSVLKDESGIE